ncbi:MAG: class I SAM-dependent methyltransferase [Rhodospirillales bacterium]|nr:class I SAM-dependent methyltransferase [Rhodospirillales bacterium]
MNKSKNEIQNQFSIQENQPSNWFEPLYSKASMDGEGVPWANMKPHPSFANWQSNNPQDGEGKSALVVGCGLGDDAIELEALGFHVTAFDISTTAIEYCKERFPESKVEFVQADLLEYQTQWHRKFDFVLEILTVQALPPKYEVELIQNISNFTAPGGLLLVIADVGKEHRTFDNGPPWLLTPEHIDSYVSCGLIVQETTAEKIPLNNDEGIYVTAFSKPSI